MTDTIVWVHADNLNPYNPALTSVANAPAIFVWDDELLASWNISLKRITFIYECLLELNVVIRRGSVAQEVANFAQEHGAKRILTAYSPSPRHRLICQKISQHMPSGSRIEIMRETPFVEYHGTIDLKRFSRYWNTVKWTALKSKR